MSSIAAELSPTEAYFYVVSDSQGMVGAFMTEYEIKEKVLTPYPIVPFRIQRFPLAQGATDQVWAVLYTNGTTAYVSNSRAESLRVQKAMANIGIVFDEEIDFWQHPMGELVTASKERLNSITHAHAMYASGLTDEVKTEKESADEDLLAELLANRGEGPIARLLKANERISFLENVIDIAVVAAVESDPAAAVESDPAAAVESDPAVVAAVETGPAAVVETELADEKHSD